MAKRALSSTQKLISMLIITTLLVISIVNLVCACVSYATLNLSGKAVDQLIENWSQGPILDIQVAATCPTGYTSPYSKTWPGTDADCYCGNANKVDFSITCDNFCSGTCSTEQLSAGCVNAPGRSAQPLNYWGVIGTTPVQICLRRSTTENFITNGVLSAGPCPDGYRTCGTNDDIKYCTKESVCPIIAAGASNATGAVAACRAGLITDCAVLEENAAINSNKIIKFYRYDSPPPTGPGLPLSQFRLNEYGMCLDPSEDNTSPNRQQYFQLAEQSSSCGTEGADLWRAADGTSETYLFFLNGLSSYIASLAAFPNPGMSGYYPTGTSGNNYLYYLFQQTYVPWKAEHRDQMQTLLDNLDLIERIDHSQLGYLIISVIAAFFIGIVTVLLECLNLFGNVREGGKLRKLTKALEYFLLIASLAIILWAVIIVGVARSFFRSASSNEVSLDYVNFNLRDFADHLNRAFACTLISVLVTGIGLLFLLGLECFARRARRNNRGAAAKQGYDHTSAHRERQGQELEAPQMAN